MEQQQITWKQRPALNNLRIQQTKIDFSQRLPIF